MSAHTQREPLPGTYPALVQEIATLRAQNAELRVMLNETSFSPAQMDRVSAQRDALAAALREIALTQHPDAEEHNPLVQGARSNDEVLDRVVAKARSALDALDGGK